LMLTQSTLRGQGVPQPAEFSVSVPSATIRKAPSVGSPIIGQAPRGAVLEVTRDIGAWVKVAWPDADDGIGYVHQSMGTLTRRASMDERLAAAFPPAPTPEPAPMPDASISRNTPPAVPMSTRTVYVAPPTHFVGFGGRFGRSTRDTAGSTLDGFGVTSRVWSRRRFGMQFDATRSTLESDGFASRVTSVELAPSLVYALADRVTDYVWLRPYVGAGGAWSRATLKSTTPGDLSSTSDDSLGFRAFGGAELAFPSVPRFAVSADAGYLWSQQPFDGFKLGGVGFSLSAHWYVK
jgi:Bacterial SH3 domain